MYMQIKQINTAEGADEAMAYLETCDKIAVGCEGDLTNAGQICLIQVRLLCWFCSASRSLLAGAKMCGLLCGNVTCAYIVTVLTMISCIRRHPY